MKTATPMHRLYLTATLFLVASAALAQEQQNSIDTDRPSITETTSTVTISKFQAEGGFLHEQHGQDEYTLSAPNVLWKYGLLENLELRVYTELTTEINGRETATGLSPLIIGFKVKLCPEQGLLPETSAIAQVELNKFATQEFQEEHAAPTLKLLFNNTLTPTLGLGYNMGVEWSADSGCPSFQYSVCPSFEINRKFKTFIEAYGFLPTSHHADYWVDGGLQFLLTDNIQLDVAGGYELSAQNHYHGYFETVGVSLKI